MSTDLRGYFPAFAMLLVGVIAGCAAGGQPATSPPAETVTVTREFHPSGPTTLRAWRQNNDTEPYRIELLHARTGRLLIGQARLLQVPDGTWVIARSDGSRLALQMPVGQAPGPALTLQEAGQIWSVHVTRQIIPTATPGIANEQEPALDLLLERQR